jgi:probable HAF family extracellular repeat protein
MKHGWPWRRLRLEVAMRRPAPSASARWRRTLILGVALATGATAAAAAPRYSLVDFGALTQAQAPVVRGPNSHGHAGGSGRLDGAGDAGGRRGLVFGGGPSAEQVEGLVGREDAAIFSINDSGVFVGSANTDTAVRAFAGSRSGIRELPPLAGDSASVAFGINGQGEAVGFSSGAAGERAVVWDAGGRPSALPPVAGAAGSRANDISRWGDVAGVAAGPAGRLPVLWARGQLARALQLIPGDSTGEASAVNARGEAVGYTASAAGPVRHAALWSATGEVTALGALPGGESSEALGINDAGAVVGTAGSGAGPRAFLWTRAGGLQDLNALVPRSHVVLTKAVGINNAGAIVVLGEEAPPGGAAGGGGGHVAHERPVRVFLLHPVPP